MASDPRPLLAVLADADRRLLLSDVTVAAARLSPVVAERLPASDRRRLEALERVGLVEVVDGLAWPRDPFTATLEPTPPRAGIERFVHEGRIRDWPRRPADRLALMRWASEQAVAVDETVDEPTVTARLGAVWRDPVTLRRDLVDAGLLARDPEGRAYRRA
ncbi:MULTISPECIES: DUF2087 domain-containing protein [unclassified Agrococcus]|uniref:DUF2087 domain-containing protein n=1 Tax=unclassified Agrococcus TaxID=2615065 RepID=UPI0036162305